MMDSREPQDSNVVRLRREGEPSDEERERLASTIFASEDEIGPFSRGNLVPPAPAASSDEPTTVEDPFFDQQLREPRPAESSTRLAMESDEFFSRLAEQDAVEMAEQLRSRRPPPAALPGSAQIPQPKQRSGRVAARRSSRPAVHIGRPRLARSGRRAVGATGLLVVGAGLATVLANIQVVHLSM
jgi:hypothetical protein